MLQTVMRPSIDSARIASPAYSITEPVPPAVPISPMIARMMSLAVTPSGSAPLTGDAHVLGFFLDQRLRGQHMLHLAGADAVGQRAESAMRRGVAVAAHNGHAGQREALFRPDDVDDALTNVDLVVIFDAELGSVLGQRLDLMRLSGRFLMPCAVERGPWVVGTLWSTTASVFLRRRFCTLRPAMRRPSKACGLVTSCTRWRSI
jgi:hypothetical protein